jgi:hypothetical protein
MSQLVAFLNLKELSTSDERGEIPMLFPPGHFHMFKVGRVNLSCTGTEKNMNERNALGKLGKTIGSGGMVGIADMVLVCL